MIKNSYMMLVYCCTTMVYGGVSQSLDHFFNRLGYGTALAEPMVYKGQAAHYYQGGRFSLRSGVEQIDLVGVQPPSWSTGCGGIDWFTGGFSFINSDQFVQAGKAIVSSALPFAVDLALQTWAPQIKSIKDHLLSVANRARDLSVNSCETAQAGIAALAGFAGVGSQQHICQAMATQNNTFASWVSARQGCRSPEVAQQQLQHARQNKPLQDMVKRARNIVWDALKKQEFPFQDESLNHFLQSLSGTIVYDAQGVKKLYGSLMLLDGGFVDTLLEGGERMAYQCLDRPHCLRVEKRATLLEKKEAFMFKILKKMEQLMRHIYEDTPLNEEEKQFIEWLDIPLLTLFIDSIAVGQPPPLTAYSRVVAVDLLVQWLQRLMQHLQQVLLQSHNDAADMKVLIQNIQQARIEIEKKAHRARETIYMWQQSVRHARYQTRLLESRISGKVLLTKPYTGESF